MPYPTDPLVRLVCSCGRFRGKGTMEKVSADFERHWLELHAKQLEADYGEAEKSSADSNGDGS